MTTRVWMFGRCRDKTLISGVCEEIQLDSVILWKTSCEAACIDVLIQSA
jgi:hypothetical protein